MRMLWTWIFLAFGIQASKLNCTQHGSYWCEVEEAHRLNIEPPLIGFNACHILSKEALWKTSENLLAQGASKDAYLLPLRMDSDREEQYIVKVPHPIVDPSNPPRGILWLKWELYVAHYLNHPNIFMPVGQCWTDNLKGNVVEFLHPIPHTSSKNDPTGLQCLRVRSLLLGDLVHLFEYFDENNILLCDLHKGQFMFGDGRIKLVDLDSLTTFVNPLGSDTYCSKDSSCVAALDHLEPKCLRYKTREVFNLFEFLESNQSFPADFRCDVHTKKCRGINGATQLYLFVVRVVLPLLWECSSPENSGGEEASPLERKDQFSDMMRSRYPQYAEEVDWVLRNCLSHLPQERCSWEDLRDILSQIALRR